MILNAIGRLIGVTLSFLLAAAAALFVLVTLGLERVTQAAKRGAGGELGNLEVLVDVVWQGGLLVSGLTVLPALAVVIVGEVARIRSSVYYIVGGGLALVAIPLLARMGTGGGSLPPAVVWQVFATAGFAGGWLYWLLAGRRA